MWSPDTINALFNLGGAAAISSSIWRLLNDKMVKGIHWGMLIFFASWSTWNLYFYYYFSQWYSVAAGVIMVASELVYLSLLIYYARHEPANDSYAAYLKEEFNGHPEIRRK